ncbi:MAG TPA: sigma-70 family RNA polymerase sigma factor [Anaeromyxobacteraceae bacterium]|nr:sigma-70 family RNA polymerase sigma factor [Anaeromyxobacteraceae bacterium]
MSLDLRVKELLAEGRHGDAAGEAIRTLGPEVLSYLASVLRNDADAAEVFSQFAEDLWKGLSGFRGEATLRGWAYRIAWHACVRFTRDPYRRRGRRLDTSEASRLADEVRSTLLGDAWRRDRMAQLRDALTPEEQTLLILRVDRALSWRDVADVLAGEGQAPASEAALRKRFERLKEKLGKAAREEGLID